MRFRYEYRFDLDYPHAEAGLRTQFFIDFDSVCEVQDLANFPHHKRREWARKLLHKYRYTGKTTLTDADYSCDYGQVVKIACPHGATVTTIEPNKLAHDIILIIQVILFFIFFKINIQRMSK